MRAAAAGREVFGYNRSIEAVQLANADGFDATENIDEALSRAAAGKRSSCSPCRCPGCHRCRADVRDVAPDSPLTDVTSVEGCVLDEVQSFGLRGPLRRRSSDGGHRALRLGGGHARMFVGAPWVVTVDDHVDAAVWSMVMDLALDCGAVVVPARSDEHDAAAATISHLPHLLAEALAVTAGEVPLAFALAAGSFRDGTPGRATAPDLVRAMCEANADQVLPVLERTLDLLGQTRDALAAKMPVSEVVEAGHAARVRYDNFGRPEIVTIVIGAEKWREELAAAGRAGGVIRSALPALGSRG